MRRVRQILVWVPCAWALMACASTGGPGDLSGTYSRDFGRLLIPTLEEARLKIWAKHNWHLQREQVEYQNVYWESQWRPFNPPEVEGLTRPADARVRILLRGRRVGGDLDGGSIYRVTFEGEYQVLDRLSREWRPAPVPPEARETFALVAGDLSLEVRTGVRR